MAAQSTKGIDDLAREHAPDAIGVLVEEMQNAVESRDRIRAAEAVLDRGYGKPSQAIIQVPANRRQAALLAAMSDDALIATIEQKVLPRLGPPQPLITVDPLLQ
jgi:translation initiation factor IF-2